MFEKRLQKLWSLVGSTPMLGIQYEFQGVKKTMYAKCEHFNLTGSIKDRMALYILQSAYLEKTIKPGDRIIEVSSGNTGISFAAIGCGLGHPVTIIIPDWLSRERIDIIRSLGADVNLISEKQGGFLESIRIAQEMADGQTDIFLPRQFANTANSDAHFLSTGPEIWQQLQSLSLVPDAFVAGVGTGGTVMGVGRYLKIKNPRIRIYPVEPAESPTLSAGHKVGSHRIQGISDEFIPAILQLDTLSNPIQIADGDAILMAQKFSKDLGLAVGISSGANILGVIQAQNAMSGNVNVVTVLPDCNKKYLSTDLLKEEPVKSHYLTPSVRLINYQPVRRLNINNASNEYPIT